MIGFQPFQNRCINGIRTGGDADAGKLSCSQKRLCRLQQGDLIRRLYCGKTAAEKGDLRRLQRSAALQHFPAGLCDLFRLRRMDGAADGALVTETALMRTATVRNEKGKSLMLCHIP